MRSRIAKAGRLCPLVGQANPEAAEGLGFITHLGTSFSNASDWPFLITEIITATDADAFLRPIGDGPLKAAAQDRRIRRPISEDAGPLAGSSIAD